MKAAPQRKSTSTSNSTAVPFFQTKPEHATLDVEATESKQPTFFRSSTADSAGGTTLVQPNRAESELETQEHQNQQEETKQVDLQRTSESDQPTAGNRLQAKFESNHTPFFQPIHVPAIQAEEREQEEEQNPETLPVQRKPIFESEEDSTTSGEDQIQRYAISDIGAIALQSATLETRPTSEIKEQEKQNQEEPIAKRSQIQMMPVFGIAGTSDDGEENNAVQSPVQFRLVIGQPRDSYEREADAMAERVAALSRARAVTNANTLTTSQPQQINRKPESLMKQSDTPVDWMSALKKRAWGEDPKTLRSAQPQQVSRKSATLMMQPNDKPSLASNQLESRLHQAKGSGAPLDVDTRTEMEDAFSSDFSGVQVHTGQEAASLSQSLGARAFTHGNSIFFNRGEYQPQSERGKHLLAHELTHTIQQGHGVQRKTTGSSSFPANQTVPGLQREPDEPANQATVSSEVVDLSSGSFNPSDKIKGEVEAQGDKSLDVRTMIKGVTSEGLVKVKVDRSGNYDSRGKGSMPLRNAWADQLGGMYVNYTVKNNQITDGYASLTAKGDNTNDWLKALKKNSVVLGGLGLKVGNLPTPVNKLEGGKLTLGVNDLNVEVGDFVDAQFNLLLENINKPKIDATANINVKGIARGVLKLDNTQEKLTGEVGLSIDLKGFSGEAKVKYKEDGAIDIGGKAGYNANKLSGAIEFVTTDLETANRFARDAITTAGGKEKVQDAPPPAPVPAAKEGSKSRALAATGQLGFNLTSWFAGTVNVVVDANGNITAIGRINPPAEIELFKQRDWEKEIITLEARAYYGVPLVGNLNVFANIGLYALAKLGPAKIYNIEVLGTYSTDPNIQRNIQISGSLNISAYAGLRLRAEGGAGVELLAHDLRFGVGLNADVGVKAYADARPTIGYRDSGVFYFSGTLEMVAMPMLGLGGDFFIELDSPWWSPAPDKKWLWPLFSKEWPLTDPIGLNAVLKDYELGSGKVPEIEFKKPEFDPSKFMTNMVDNKLPAKSGGKARGQGSFKEDASAPKPAVKPTKAAPAQKGAKPSKKGAPPPLGKSAKPNPMAANAEKSMMLLADAAKKIPTLKAKAPFTQPELNTDLNKIKGQVSGVSFSVKPRDKMWAITPNAGGKKGRPFELAAKDVNGQAENLPKDKEIGETINFTAGGEGHKLWVSVKGETAQLMLASQTKPLSQHLTKFGTDAKNIKDSKTKTQVLGWINTATPLAKSIERDAKRAVSRIIDSPEREKIDARIEDYERKLRPILTNILNKLNVRVPDKIMPAISLQFTTYPALDLTEYSRQLEMQEAVINTMVVEDWWTNRERFKERKRAAGSGGRHPMSQQAQQDLRARIRNQLTLRLTLPVNATGADVDVINADSHLRNFVASVFAKYPSAQHSGLAESIASREVNTWMRTQHALHSPDQVAGGRYDQLTGLGSGWVNTDIGMNWGGLRRFGKPVHLANKLEFDVQDSMRRLNIERTFWRQVKMHVILSTI